MDAAEPSANNITASNLHRLASMLDDSEYATLARETVAAFEAEVEQFPWCFVGMLGSVVISHLGTKSVVIMGEVENVKEKIRGSVGAGRTVVWGQGEWVRERNKLVGALDKEKKGVFVCKGRTCREGSEFL